MNLLNRLGFFRTGDVAKIVSDAASNILNTNFYGYMGTGRVAYTMDSNKEKYITEGYCDNENVYAVVRVILQKLKVAPMILSQVKEDGEKFLTHYKEFRYKSDDQSMIQTRLFKRKALRELSKHPVLRLLKKPNSYQTQSQFLEAAAGFYLTLGETFIYKITPNDGSKRHNVPLELHVLPAHLVVPVFSGDVQNPIRGYAFTLGNQTLEIPAEKVLHIKTWNPNWDLNGTQLRGFAPLEAGRRALVRNRANNEAQTRAYVNGGSAYLLSSDNDSKMLTQPQIDLINERIKEKIVGVENYNTITATSGMVKATKIGDTPTDLKLIEGDKHDRGKIASLFGVDPLLVGDKENSSYNNQEAAYKALVTNTIIPILKEFSAEFDSWLLPHFLDDMEEDEGELLLEYDTTVYPELQPDMKLMMEVYGRPLLSENERRSIFLWDADPDPLMNKKYIPRNLIALDSLDTLNGQMEEVQSTTRVTRAQSQQTDGND